MGSDLDKSSVVGGNVPAKVRKLRTQKWSHGPSHKHCTQYLWVQIQIQTNRSRWAAMIPRWAAMIPRISMGFRAGIFH